jgi:hypothetical protein
MVACLPHCQPQPESCVETHPPMVSTFSYSPLGVFSRLSALKDSERIPTVKKEFQRLFFLLKILHSSHAHRPAALSAPPTSFLAGRLCCRCPAERAGILLSASDGGADENTSFSFTLIRILLESALVFGTSTIVGRRLRVDKERQPRP